MRISDLHHPTNRVVFDALVHLVRKVPWGASRERLEQEAARLAAEAAALSESTGRVRDPALRDMIGRLRWSSELFLLASRTRFPREGDTVVGRFTEVVVEDLRNFQAWPDGQRGTGAGDVFEAVSAALETHGASLDDLPLPPTLNDLIDSGAERPDYVDEERWNNAVKAYYHRMTLDNTPHEFIYGEADGFDEGWPGDEHELDALDAEAASAPAM